MADQDAGEQDLSAEGTGGRLGRLFAALVGGAAEVDLTDAAARAAGDAADAPGAGAADAPSSLDVEKLSRELLSSPDPVALLASLVADVRDRTRAAAAAGTPGPSALERHLAARLAEAGVAGEKDAGGDAQGGGNETRLPALHVVRPRTSDLFYLRVEEARLTYDAKISVLRAEAALNGALLASRLLPDANTATEAELVRTEQRVARSIVSQASRVAARIDGPARGEWAVRYALAYGIEAFQLPWRLTARFRVNVAAGAAALECDLVPPRAWAETAYVDGLGVVAATSEMRRRAATDYNLRLVVLLARYAFLACDELREVWVAGVRDSGRDHRCYVSVRFERELLEGTDLEGPFDPLVLLRSCDARVDADERARTLSPVAQHFSLEDERFCPARRWKAPELSSRALRPAEAAALGCVRASGLAVDEAAARRHVAAELVRGLSTSTEANVRLILSATADAEEADVRAAGARCVSELIEGTLEDDPEAIAEAFVSGDALSREAARAQELLLTQDPEGALVAATEALRAGGPDASFADTDTVTWRAFGNYAERALYNRLFAQPGREVRLVPEGYVEALLIAAVAELALGRADEAVTHARRAAELAPLSTQTSLGLAQALEAAGRPEEAEAELCRLLSLAHDPEGLGLGYLRMAQHQWQHGHVLAAQACYQRACRHLSASALVAGLAAVALLGQVGAAAGGTLPDDQADQVLRAAHIPLAPTEEVGTVFLEATHAAVDAELWGAARSLTHTLAVMTRDDVTFGLLRSLEDEPDR